MTAERVNLAHYHLSHAGIEGALKGFNLHNDTPFLESLQKLGYNHRLPSRTYPYPQCIAIIRAILSHAMPHSSEYSRTKEWGIRQYDGLGQTIVGRAAYVVFRAMPFPRTLAYAVQIQNRDSTFGHRSLVQIAPCHYRIVYDDDPGGHDNGFFMNCIVAVYQRMCEASRVPNAEVIARITGTLRFEIDVRWHE